MSHPHNTEPVVAIVVTTGSGVSPDRGPLADLRPVAGVPLVARSVNQLAAGGCDAALVMVAPGTAGDFARELESAPIPVTLVVGGPRRQDSVRNGLVAMEDDETLASCAVVLVHDADRALVPTEVVARVIGAVRGGAIAVAPVLEVGDTIRQVNEVGSAVIDRATLRVVQTPQGFDREALADAHRLVAEHQQAVLDDVVACEYAGHTATLVPGHADAFSVADERLFALAEVLLGS